MLTADIAEKLILPLIGLASGWLLAMWKGARHRSWESLTSDLDLADKVEEHLPDYAEWLRMSVAVRLKGRAIFDSRPRLDLLQATLGGMVVALGIAGTRVFGKDVTQSANGWDAFGNWFFLGAMLFVVGAGAFAIGRDGLTSRYRVPGISDLFMSGSTKSQRTELTAQLRKLNERAKRLPEAVPSPEPAGDESPRQA